MNFSLCLKRKKDSSYEAKSLFVEIRDLAGLDEPVSGVRQYV